MPQGPPRQYSSLKNWPLARQGCVAPIFNTFSMKPARTTFLLGVNIFVLSLVTYKQANYLWLGRHQIQKIINYILFRWFVLDPESGRLEYYLLEERNGRCRGSHYLAGALVLPSDEDSQTFSVNFASGEVYKVSYLKIHF